MPPTKGRIGGLHGVPVNSRVPCLKSNTLPWVNSTAKVLLFPESIVIGVDPSQSVNLNVAPAGDVTLPLVKVTCPVLAVTVTVLVIGVFGSGFPNDKIGGLTSNLSILLAGAKYSEDLVILYPFLSVISIFRFLLESSQPIGDFH